MNSRLDQSELLNEKVQADELQELLSRLAATEALFAEPVPTIRDVAEATDASPLLIGRILSQMRGPDGVAELKGRMDGFEARLRQLEAKRLPHSLQSPRQVDEILRSAGTSTFKPLDKQSSKTVVPAELSEQSWSQVKHWYGSGSERVDFVNDEVLAKNSTYWVIIGIAFLYFAFVFGGQCNSEPRDQYQRPIPFPIERSTR
jgi:hypothetical protein